jgi:hypothetical protein
VSGIGPEWIVDAEGCPAGLLRDVAALQSLFDRLDMIFCSSRRQFTDPTLAQPISKQR